MVYDHQCSQTCFCLNHFFKFLWKMFSSVCIFSSTGRLFQSSVPWTENVDCANLVFLFGTVQFWLVAPLVVIPLLLCFDINWHIISGARLFTHLKTILIGDKLIRFSKLSKLYFCTILQWCHLFGFLSKIFSVCLYRDLTGLIVSWETWLQTVTQ